jgi:peroxiredoxin
MPEKAAGAQLVAVTPQKPDRSLEQFKTDPPGFPVLSDLSSDVMKAYKLYFEVDPELAAVYRKNGLDLEAFNGEGRVLPVAATFVFDPTGVVRAMQADTDYTKRMEPADALAAVRALALAP